MTIEPTTLPKPYVLKLEADAVRLQAIADAWRDYRNPQKNVQWPTIVALLDALGDTE
jgi:hypothetical protein